MPSISLTASDILAVLALTLAAILLLCALISSRRRRADRTILDAFELGGRMSIDPTEVTGSRMLRKRVGVLRAAGLLRTTERGMLVPETGQLAASIDRRRSNAPWLALAALVCVVGSAVLALRLFS